jgi:hypothetical protein
MIQVGDIFDSIPKAREAIKAYILDRAESYKTVASDKTRYIIACKDAHCKFRIRANKSFKGVVSITVLDPHTCNPVTHYKMKQTSSV